MSKNQTPKPPTEEISPLAASEDNSAVASLLEPSLQERDKAKSLDQNTNAEFDHKTFLKHLTTRAGVYQMHDDTGEVIYIGKAKNLKNRVSSYFSARGLSAKTLALVSRIARIDVTVTQTESEALILEQNLIKTHRPPFNILLRDDKSYPYVFLSDGDFPRVAYHRGAKRAKGRYFGPYPSAGAVRESLNLLQRIFKMRQCEDSYYRARSRPCLQYQIKRCTAPCVGIVSDAEYSEQVRHTRLFLEGKNADLVRLLGDEMQEASKELEFEKAAELRDQIQYLQKVTESQFIEAEADANADVVAIHLKAGMCCVHILFIRAGRILGSKSYYPRLTLDQSEAEVLELFLEQFYVDRAQHNNQDMPSTVYVANISSGLEVIADAVASLANTKITFNTPSHGTVKGAAIKWLELAETTAAENIKNRLADKQSMLARFEDLQTRFELDDMPNRIECFDISHSSGEDTVASCVVFDQHGPVKSDYRKFNIEGITGGDDYAAMKQALTRRFKRLASGEGKCPDILLIDGGKGQVTQAKEVLAEYQLNHILVIGVAKGPTRKAGFEQLILANENRVIKLEDDAKALHLIQHVRDESHRFAIKSHTAKRDKKRSKSQLDGIPGVGPKRRKDLLAYFGSVKAITEAPVRELVKVPGISKKVAEDIYGAFHLE